MVSNDLCYHPMRKETSFYEERAEEARPLSFCDLSDDASADWDHLTHQPRSNGEDELFFDFFSSGFSFTTSTHPGYPPETIVFCGKQLDPSEVESKQRNKVKHRNLKKVINWVMPSSSMLTRTKTMSGSSASSKQKRKNGRGKWWMLMPGSMRVPNEMELADIRTRQERRPPEAIKAFVAMFEDHEQQRNNVGMETRTTSLPSRKSPANGLVGIVRSFSCRGYFSAGRKRLD